ncbi:hypothetical protein M8J75_004019 [Diaphorina citri]|nr:hypothetical protein M8J75_004019 [Diaphorina citri]
MEIFLTPQKNNTKSIHANSSNLRGPPSCLYSYKVVSNAKLANHAISGILMFTSTHAYIPELTSSNPEEVEGLITHANSG